MPDRLDDEELADWRAGRNAVYQLAAHTIGGRLFCPATSGTNYPIRTAVLRAGATKPESLSRRCASGDDFVNVPENISRGRDITMTEPG